MPASPMGRTRLRSICLASAACAVLQLPRTAAAASTTNAQGQVGLTSYVTLPFFGSVFQLSWGSGAGLDPAQLFWRDGSHFTNASTMGEARGAAAGWAANGIVPYAQAQRWEDTYEVAQSSSQFPDEPVYADGSDFGGDRADGVASGPEFKAWVAWLQARPNLPIMASDGGSAPTYFRAWNGSWGHVSPLMPLNDADCPNGLSSCTYGDWLAARWGETASLSGAYGIGLSDFSTGQPGISTQVGFNPAIVSAFAGTEGVAVPGGSTAAQSSWIVGNAISPWNDYLSAGYAKYFAAIATAITAGTGQQALVIQQGSLWPALGRFFGNDERLIRNAMSPANYVCEWDDQSMQVGRGGQDPVWGVGAYAVAAAREPDLRNGANLEAIDSAYWSAIAAFNPNLDSADQQEKGLKLLKRSWLEAAWAHIATRQGTVRRALAFVSRDYWDGGTIDPTVQTLISSIVPTAPFGFALYYSTAAERAVEQQVATGNPYVTAYDNPGELLALKNAGVPVNYFVSDAALPSLGSTARPAGWLLLEHPELVPAAEMAKLQAIAPVFTGAAAALADRNAPLSFSGGLTGTAFYDQNGRLIITVTNPTNSTINGDVTVRGVAGGQYGVLNLFDGTGTTVPVGDGVVSVPISVGRWDTLAYAISRPF